MNNAKVSIGDEIAKFNTSNALRVIRQIEDQIKVYRADIERENGTWFMVVEHASAEIEVELSEEMIAAVASIFEGV